MATGTQVKPRVAEARLLVVEDDLVMLARLDQHPLAQAPVDVLGLNATNSQPPALSAASWQETPRFWAATPKLRAGKRNHDQSKPYVHAT
jgi:hypothetical protein